MSHIQVALYLFALLSIYAIASKLDEPASLPVDRHLPESVDARCVFHAQHRVTLSADAASGPPHVDLPVRVAC